MKIITKLVGESEQAIDETISQAQSMLGGAHVEGPDGIVRFLAIDPDRIRLHHCDRAIVIPFSVLFDFAKTIDPKFAETPKETGPNEVQDETTQPLPPGVKPPRLATGGFGIVPRRN